MPDLSSAPSVPEQWQVAPCSGQLKIDSTTAHTTASSADHIFNQTLTVIGGSTEPRSRQNFFAVEHSPLYMQVAAWFVSLTDNYTVHTLNFLFRVLGQDKSVSKVSPELLAVGASRLLPDATVMLALELFNCLIGSGLIIVLSSSD